MPEHRGTKIHAVNRELARQDFETRHRLLKVTQPGPNLEPGNPFL
jgi:hypothetical protein